MLISDISCSSYANHAENAALMLQSGLDMTYSDRPLHFLALIAVAFIVIRLA